MIQNDTDVNLRKNIRFYCGSSGAGKSHAIKEYLSTVTDRAGIYIFDPEEEYAEGEGVQSFTDLREYAAAVFEARERGQRGAWAYIGQGQAKFAAWCAVVWSIRGASWPSLAVVDELSSVTKGSGKAAGHWLDMLTRGRKYNLHICAGAQTPAEIDKTIMRQKSYIWIGYLDRPEDHRYIGGQTRITVEQAEKLRPAPHYDHWVIEEGKAPEFHTARE